MRYLFYNIYGDADELIASKPSDVILVPFGWDPQTEENRNNIIFKLNCTVSSLPSLIYYKDEYSYQSEDQNKNPITILVPAHWEEIRISDLPKPWTWQNIEAQQK